MASHVPVRQCVACRTRAPQEQLVRFVRADGIFRVDGRPRGPGRGAYLCSQRCALRIAKHKRYSGLAEAAVGVAWSISTALCTGETAVYDSRVPP